MVEFDVLRRPSDGMLVLAHDLHDLKRPDLLTLEAGLEIFRHESWAGIDLDVDMKHWGYEADISAALRRHKLSDRVIVSSMHRTSLMRLRALDPALQLGLSIPKVRRDWSQSRIKWAIYPRMAALYRSIRITGPAAVRAGTADALMVHYKLISRQLIEAVHEADGEIYAWTVDDGPTINRLESLGVDAVITNDPRLFTSEPQVATS